MEDQLNNPISKTPKYFPRYALAIVGLQRCFSSTVNSKYDIGS